MIGETDSTTTQKQLPFGARLQSSREARGLDRKDVASQLYLREHMIAMMESGELKSGLPLTFVRGYLQSYSRFLEIPEHEIAEALETLSTPSAAEKTTAALSARVAPPSPPFWTTRRTSHRSRLITQLFTFLIVLTLIGLVGAWWNSHKTTNNYPSNALHTDISTAPTTGVVTTTITNTTITHSETPTTRASSTAARPLLTPWVSNDQEAAITEFALSSDSVQTAGYLILLSIIFYLGTRLTHKPWAKIVATFFSSAAIIVLLGSGYALLNQSMPIKPVKIKRPATPVVQPSVTTAATAAPVAPVELVTLPPETTISLEADLETLAPTSNLDPVVSAATKVTPQEQLIPAVNDYINQAAALKVTVDSMNVSETPHKKKIRKRRHIYNNNNDHYDNNVPPYYRYNY